MVKKLTTKNYGNGLNINLRFAIYFTHIIFFDITVDNKQIIIF